MNDRIVTFVLCSIAFSAHATPLTPGTLNKLGNCPSGYVAKGNECEPAKDARFAIQKSGECPSDYEADGNYCLATAGAKLALRKAAMTCPKGFETVEDYCISDK